MKYDNKYAGQDYLGGQENAKKLKRIIKIAIGIILIISVIIWLII